MRISRDALAIVPIEGKGRGVVATRDIRQGELLDEAPVLIYPKERTEGLKIHDYSFWWDDDHLAIAFGWISLINHSSDPNASIELDREAKRIRIWSRYDIPAGTEIAYDYGGDLWFDPVE